LARKLVVTIGDEELKSGMLVLRDMATKEQRTLREDELFL
jgi:histidyl-tRNA synthetase